jgi:hypothetical protein
MAPPDKKGIFPDHTMDLIRFAQTRTHYEGLADYFLNRFRDPLKNPTKSAIANRLDTLVTGTFFGDLTCGKSTINLEEAIAYRKVLLFNLGKGILSDDESQTFGRLIVALVQGIAVRRDFDRKYTPIHFLIDEVHNYATASMKTVLREARKYQLYLTSVQQSIGDEMKPDLARLMKSQTLIHITGMAQRDEQKNAAAFVGCEIEDIATLGPGEFYMSVNSRPPVRFQGRSDLLGLRNSMTVPSWVIQVERQLERYYRPRYGEAKFDPEVVETMERNDPAEAPPAPPAATPDDDDEVRPGAF